MQLTSLVVVFFMQRVMEEQGRETIRLGNTGSRESTGNRGIYQGLLFICSRVLALVIVGKWKMTTNMPTRDV